MNIEYFTVNVNTEFEEMEIFSDLETGRFSGLGDTGCHSLPYLKNFRPENYSLTKVIKYDISSFWNHVSLVTITSFIQNNFNGFTGKI
jgi:hypothetical protein